MNRLAELALQLARRLASQVPQIYIRPEQGAYIYILAVACGVCRIRICKLIKIYRFRSTADGKHQEFVGTDNPAELFVYTCSSAHVHLSWCFAHCYPFTPVVVNGRAPH